MADNAINEMISAYAIGCMDKENYEQFRKYLVNNGELPKGELGDLQNIVSLIPTILDIETPSEELKNELGKRLIKIQIDIKNKVVENRRETRINATDEFVRQNDSTRVFDVSEKRVGTPNQSFIAEPLKKIRHETTQKRTENVTRLNTISEPIKTNSNLANIFHWVFSGLILIALIVFSFILMNRVAVLDETNSELNSKVVKLRTDLSQTDAFVNQNMAFVEFFNNPYIDIISLKGASPNSKEGGRLFIAFGSGEGLLQLQNMPYIDAETTFKLWLVSTGGTFLLGTFDIKPDVKYMPISEIPFVLKEEIEMFRITKQKREDTLSPTGETILFGALRKEPLPNIKRR